MSAVGLLAVMRYQQYPSWTTHVAAWVAMPGLVMLIAGGRHFKLAGASKRVRSVCVWLGLFSYPCYILHYQMLLLLDHFAEPLLPHFLVTQPLLRAVIGIIVILPLLMVIGPALEKFFMRWRSHFLRSYGTRSLVVES